MSTRVDLSNVTVRPFSKYLICGNGVPRFSFDVEHIRSENKHEFFKVICWGALADQARDRLRMGAVVNIDGELTQRTWVTPEGEKKNIVEIVASGIEIDSLGERLGSYDDTEDRCDEVYYAGYWEFNE